MTLPRIERLHTDFGAKVTGIDMSNDIGSGVASDLRAAVDEYSLIYFPDQPFVVTAAERDEAYQVQVCTPVVPLLIGWCVSEEGGPK